MLKAVQDKEKLLDEEKKAQLALEKMILERNFQDPEREHEEITKKKVRCSIVELWGNT